MTTPDNRTVPMTEADRRALDIPLMVVLKVAAVEFGRLPSALCLEGMLVLAASLIRYVAHRRGTSSTEQLEHVRYNMQLGNELKVDEAQRGKQS